MNWHSNAGKSKLIKMLMKEHGFSKRKSEKAVNAVFTCVTGALRRGEEVELPIDWIRTAWPPAKRKKQKLQKFNKIQTGETFYRLARLPDKIIRFRPNPKLIFGLIPQQPQASIRAHRGAPGGNTGPGGRGSRLRRQHHRRGHFRVSPRPPSAD
jgi:nucleoid DNA-binding protein